MTIKKLPALFLMLFSVYGFAQTNFVKGYFINNENDRIECLINDLSWKENPSGFEFKINEASQTQNRTMAQVQEFGIGELIRYVRTDINIDKSFRDGESEINDRKPNYVGQTVFIEVLIDGPASLYKYQEGKDKWFFFESDGKSGPEQLIYRNYIPKKGNIEEYSLFRQQLNFLSECGTISNDRLQKVLYTQNDLGNLFQKFNSCNAADQTSFIGNRDRSLFNFTLRPGLDFNEISFASSSSNQNYEAQAGFRLGFEVEKQFLLQQKRWSFIMELAFKQIVIETDSEEQSLRALEAPIGLRHYFKPNAGHGLFVDASYVLDFTSFKNGITGGIGYKHKSNFLVQFKYAQRKNIELVFDGIEGDLNTYTVLIGYSF